MEDTQSIDLGVETQEATMEDVESCLSYFTIIGKEHGLSSHVPFKGCVKS